MFDNSEKATVRREIRKRIENLPDKEKLSETISDVLSALPEIRNARRIAGYFALRDEVDIDKFMISAAKNREVYAPVTEEELTFYKFSEIEKLKCGKYGIREPISSETCEDFDVIIVPMVAFDEAKNRLGRGKGYYDRFLKTGCAVKIGVAFDCQKAKFPTEPHDVGMDVIVTEREIIYGKD